MTDDHLKIFVDAMRPTILNDGAGKHFATLEQGVVAWRALPAAVKIRATIKLIGGPVYRAHQIDRLYHEPRKE
jgi:hypothetical protein